MKIVTLAFIAFSSLAGCATAFKSNRQNVVFQGGPSEGVTYVQTPDGKFELNGGSGSYLMTRTNSNVPITVTCPDGKTTQAVIETKFDFLMGGVANVLNGGWGWFVDPFNDKSYDYPKHVSVGNYCPQSARATASEPK